MQKRAGQQWPALLSLTEGLRIHRSQRELAARTSAFSKYDNARYRLENITSAIPKTAWLMLKKASLEIYRKSQKNS